MVARQMSNTCSKKATMSQLLNNKLEKYLEASHVQERLNQVELENTSSYLKRR